MYRKFKAIFFDLDGTLIDSVGDKNFLEVARLLNLPSPQFPPEGFRGLFGKNIYEIIATCWPGAKIDVEKYSQAWLEVDIKNLKLFPSALESLHYCTIYNYVLGIITARPQANARIMLKNFCLEGHFDPNLVIGLLPDKYNKPDPRVFDWPIRSLGFRGIYKDNLLYIGDSGSDATCAQDAGVTFIGVETGQRTKEEFIKLNVPAENILPSVAHLPIWLERYNSH